MSTRDPEGSRMVLRAIGFINAGVLTTSVRRIIVAGMNKPRPMVVSMDSIPVVPADQAVTRVRIARLITKSRCGSNLLLGVCWMDPGEKTNTWSSRDENDMGADDHWYGPVDETYFMIRGTCASRGMTKQRISIRMTRSTFLPGGRTSWRTSGTSPHFSRTR